MTIARLIFRIINGGLMVGLPVLAALLIYRRGRGGFRPIWVGAVAFILSQVGHIPFNQYLLLPGLRGLGLDLGAQAGPSLVFLAIGAGLSAGVFEEVTRYLVFRFWLKEDDSLLPVKYGIGHGGVEALAAGIVVVFALVQVLVLSGQNALASFPAETAAVIRSQLETYWAVPGGQALLGAWERISAMIFQVGASVMVYKSVREKKVLWLLGAILGHAALDAFAVFGVKTLNLFLLEGIILAFALVWAAAAWKFRHLGPETPQEPGRPPLELNPSNSEVTPQQLEESRYD